MGGSTISPSFNIPGASPTNERDEISIAARLAVLRQALEAGVLYTCGMHEVKAQDLVIYYDVECQNHPSRIDFGSATQQDLVALAAACQQPVGGSHHRVGEMDPSKFAARLDIAASGLIDAIGSNILHGQNADGAKSLRAELQKLHVYGPGAFVNAEKIPRDDMMVGSLIVVFPTAFAGGACTAEHANDTIRIPDPITSASAPALSYLAVCGDIAQSLEPLHTGHRVTLTYGLFLADITSPAACPLADTLHALLADPAFLPAGGILASGLAHKYPIPLEPERNPEGKPITQSAQWDAMLPLLKGTDARLRAAAEHVGLAPRVQLLYEAVWQTRKDVLTADIVDLWGVHEEVLFDFPNTAAGVIERNGVVLQCGEERAEFLRARIRKMYEGCIYAQPNVEHIQESSAGVAVHWLMHPTELNRVKSAYISEDGMVEYQYGDAGLFMRVPAVGEGIRTAIA
ncbi:hypothetical protein FB451DRAFT_581980 [Mycena latifolia]|nr:hypothetical protein FB451DRAFT_581980 [Mycena latifolia]